ncbi:Uncharacterised protein [Mycobacteroides abscessus subsp. abscessus]|nr:Uncharacterised protein [Mycobacteroides abscessus subsp. abscessus]
MQTEERSACGQRLGLGLFQLGQVVDVRHVQHRGAVGLGVGVGGITDLLSQPSHLVQPFGERIQLGQCLLGARPAVPLHELLADLKAVFVHLGERGTDLLPGQCAVDHMGRARAGGQVKGQLLGLTGHPVDTSESGHDLFPHTIDTGGVVVLQVHERLRVTPECFGDALELLDAVLGNLLEILVGLRRGV